MNIEPVPELTQGDLDAIKAAAQIIRDKAPWRKAVTGGESRKLFKLGDNSLSFVDVALDEAQAHPEAVAVNFSIGNMEKRLVFLNALNGLLAEVAPVFKELDDTSTFVGADLMQDALEIYDSLKRASKKNPALVDGVGKLGERFKRTRKPASKPKPLLQESN